MATEENIYDHLMYDHRSRGRPIGPTPRLHSYRQATVTRTITEMGSMSNNDHDSLPAKCSIKTANIRIMYKRLCVALINVPLKDGSKQYTNVYGRGYFPQCCKFAKCAVVYKRIAAVAALRKTLD